MKIGDEVFVHGYVDEIRKDIVIIKNTGGYFGTDKNEITVQPEQPPYVAEIEAEYQKAVKMPYIHKPLAKALYEVWKKHDREDVERRTDEQTD